MQSIMRQAVAAAVMAPSSHNTQPWRFRIHADTLDLFADADRTLRVIDPARRQQVVSCGCALYNARVAVRAMGFTDEVTVMLVDGEEPTHLATLHVHGAHVPTEDDRARMAAIPERHTNRREFLARPVASEHVDRMIADAEAEGVRLVRLLPQQKLALAYLVDQADRLQLGDSAFRDELVRWLAPVGSSRRDGIPFVEKEYGSAMPFARLRALRSPDLAGRFAELEESRAIAAPAMLVFTTDGDTPQDWLACGQAVEAVLLRATSLGLSASFMNQVLELPELRARVHDIAPGLGYPQMVLRVGVAAHPVRHPAPRRSVDDVLCA